MSIEKDWSAVAEDFDKRQEYVIGDKTETVIEDHLASLSNLGKTIEFGCGNGKYTKYILAETDYMTATDVSPDMLEVVKNKFKGTNKVTFELADCYAANYERSSYDTVFMANLIHVVLEPARALKEAERLLRKGGRLILVSFTSDGMSPENLAGLKARYQEVFGAFPENKVPMCLQDLTKLVRACRFKIEHASLIGAGTKAMFVVASRI